MKTLNRRPLILCFCAASAWAQSQASESVPVCEVLANLDKLNHLTLRIKGDLILEETDQALWSPAGCSAPVIRGGWVWWPGLDLGIGSLTRNIRFNLTDAARKQDAQLRAQGVRRIRRVVVISCQLDVPARYKKTAAGWPAGGYPASVAVEGPIEIVAVEPYTEDQYQRYRDERRTFHAVRAASDK